MGIFIVKKYARVEGNKVVELIETDGNIGEMFPSELIWIDVSTDKQIVEGWTAEKLDGVWSISAPDSIIPSGPETIAANGAVRNKLLSIAAVRKILCRTQ